jgi:protein ImuB
VLAATGHGTQRVTAADPLAADAGIRPGMVLADARAMLPGLEIRPADPAADDRALRRLADWCRRYSPWTAPDGNDGVRLDISGCAHLFGGEGGLLDDLVARLDGFGLTARAAIADSLGAAWAVARFGPVPRRVIRPAAAADVLADLPVTALRLPEKVAADLARLGLRRIGDVCEVPRDALAPRFGDIVARRLDQALGRLDEPVAAMAPAPRFAVRLAFAEPIGHADDIARAARQLADDLCRDLGRHGHGARRVELALYLAEGTVRRIAVGCSRPSRDPVHLMRLLSEHLPALEAGFGADLMTLAAPVSEPMAAEQAGLRRLDGDADMPASASVLARSLNDPDLGRLVDRIGNRLGTVNVARIVPRQSHLPERAARAVAPLAPGGDEPWPDWRVPRPVLLLPIPQPVEAVAEVPDGPPVLFRWRGASHRVCRADGPERIAPEWWHAHATAVADLAGETRDYYRVEDTEGRRFWLYRLGLFGAAPRVPRWYLHGLFA